MNTQYHVWNADVSEKYLEVFSFLKREGFYDKFIESQMTKHYIKIIPKTFN